MMRDCFVLDHAVSLVQVSPGFWRRSAEIYAYDDGKEKLILKGKIRGIHKTREV